MRTPGPGDRRPIEPATDLCEVGDADCGGVTLHLGPLVRLLVLQAIDRCRPRPAEPVTMAFRGPWLDRHCLMLCSGLYAPHLWQKDAGGRPV